MDCPKCGSSLTSEVRPQLDDTLVGTYGQHNTFVLIIRHGWRCWRCPHTWKYAERSWSFGGDAIRKHEEADDDC